MVGAAIACACIPLFFSGASRDWPVFITFLIAAGKPLPQFIAFSNELKKFMRFSVTSQVIKAYQYTNQGLTS